ncbi:TPM domain-containing protein [Gordonia sinesedis]
MNGMHPAGVHADASFRPPSRPSLPDVSRHPASGHRATTLHGRVAALLMLIVGAGAVLLAAFAPAPAAAEPPSRIPDIVSDPAGVLTDAQREQVRQASDRLFTDHQVQLWVVYVTSFDGLTSSDWARETARISELGGNDDVLLAVATGDRAYRLYPARDIPNLSDEKLTDVANTEVVPALKRADWAGAGVGAANGLGRVLSPSNTGLITAGVVGGVAVVGAGGAVLYTRRRKRRRVDEGLETVREQELTADQLAAQPLDVLDPWSREVLTDTDNAIRTSEEELRLAVGEFGHAQTAPFADAVSAAKRGLAESFALRQRLDDNVPESTDEQRAMLVRIITTCTDVDAALDAQVTDFDEMRNLLINADARFADLTQQLVALRSRLEVSRRTLTDLVARHGDRAMASIVQNADLAAEQLTFAEEAADQGRAAIAQPAGEQGPAVAAIRSAEAAIAQAGTLLDAIDHAEENLAAANGRMPGLIAEVEGELAEAQGLATDGGPALATAVSTATAALDAAKNRFADDPLGVFTALVDADADLDTALDAARGAAAERTRRAEMLTAALTAAQAKVTAASDFIGTRRGAVGATARTRLAEAQRLLDAAHAGARQDPISAVESARAAGARADEALMAAQGDVVAWQDDQRPPPGGGSISGAVLGGILVDSFLRGATRGGFGGGYSSGGRSPGSFGGSSSSGRIGVGGRF